MPTRGQGVATVLLQQDNAVVWTGSSRAMRIDDRAEKPRTCSKLSSPTVWPHALVTRVTCPVQNEGAGQASAGGLRRHAV